MLFQHRRVRVVDVGHVFPPRIWAVRDVYTPSGVITTMNQAPSIWETLVTDVVVRKIRC
ncbi:hypothetical protein MSMEI_1643 [Mycolicibacterium smegmatis MC2 155]|uniref:Uncharacterized protein n=1 Tax=Mycolicibacterium smegmatis (strain ATCC 700084 / mc(2)155) TaxID=246196 RepID=I7F972_MYCS2|nr:hypothetical protein MSMEI_1643 [Mycolicibacterium smegmatis MC2 155]